MPGGAVPYVQLPVNLGMPIPNLGNTSPPSGCIAQNTSSSNVLSPVGQQKQPSPFLSTEKTTIDNRKVVAVKTNRSSSRPSSKYRGVYWNRNCKAWRARIWVNGKSEHLGNFDVETDAARAFDRRARELNRSQLNFPDDMDNGKDLLKVKRKRSNKRPYSRISSPYLENITAVTTTSSTNNKVEEKPRIETNDDNVSSKTDLVTAPPTPPSSTLSETSEYRDEDYEDESESMSKRAKAV